MIALEATTKQSESEEFPGVIPRTFSVLRRSNVANFSNDDVPQRIDSHCRARVDGLTAGSFEGGMLYRQVR